MLRQLFRNRAAYNNLVNVPAVASQDDPYGNRDLEGSWRRHYAQQEFREDVGYPHPYATPTTYVPVYIPVSTPPGGLPGQNAYPTTFDSSAVEAWDRPNWWTDRQLSSGAAAKILRKRLEVYGPQREKSLQEVISRIRNEKDAQTALKTAELFRRYRSSREQHVPFKNATSKMIIQRALEVDARDVVVKAFERKDELGFSFISLKAYRLAITHFSTKGDLENVFKVFALARKQGMKPNRDIAFCILRACLDCNRADLAHAYALEFQENGLRVSPAQKVLIEAGSGKKIPAFRGEEAEHAYDPIKFQVSDEEEGEVMDQADLIIAAAESDTESESIPSSPKAAPEQPVQAATKAAEPQPAAETPEQPSEATSEGASSNKVVTLASVEKAPASVSKPEKEQAATPSEESPKEAAAPKQEDRQEPLKRSHSV